MPGTCRLLERSRIHFFKTLELSNGTADAIEQLLESFLDKSSLLST